MFKRAFLIAMLICLGCGRTTTSPTRGEIIKLAGKAEYESTVILENYSNKHFQTRFLVTLKELSGIPVHINFIRLTLEDRHGWDKEVMELGTNEIAFIGDTIKGVWSKSLAFQHNMSPGEIDSFTFTVEGESTLDRNRKSNIHFVVNIGGI